MAHAPVTNPSSFPRKQRLFSHSLKRPPKHHPPHCQNIILIPSLSLSSLTLSLSTQWTQRRKRFSDPTPTPSTSCRAHPLTPTPTPQSPNPPSTPRPASTSPTRPGSRSHGARRRAGPTTRSSTRKRSPTTWAGQRKARAIRLGYFAMGYLTVVMTMRRKRVRTILEIEKIGGGSTCHFGRRLRLVGFVCR